MNTVAAPLPGDNVFFLLMGAILVFAMHGGFAFLELGTVRRRSQVNALVKIISDFGISTIVYFFIGYHIAYGISFFGNVHQLTGTDQGFAMVRFFFSADLRGSSTCHYFRGYRRARPIRAATGGDRLSGRLGLPLL